jgi:hypothetical protein
MGHRTNQLSGSPQGQDQADVFVEISHDVDPGRFRLWKSLWSRLLCPIIVILEGQEEMASWLCRRQLGAEGGSMDQCRATGVVSEDRTMNDTAAS